MTCPSLAHISAFLCRYDGYGRLTNVTYPTGKVSSYRADADSSVRIQTEGSNKEDITVTTNLSASGTFYTLMQGECLFLSLISGACVISVCMCINTSVRRLNFALPKKNVFCLWFLCAVNDCV